MKYYLMGNQVDDTLSRFRQLINKTDEIVENLNRLADRLSRQRHGKIDVCVRSIRSKAHELSRLGNALRYERDCLKQIANKTVEYENKAYQYLIRSDEQKIRDSVINSTRLLKLKEIQRTSDEYQQILKARIAKGIWDRIEAIIQSVISGMAAIPKGIAQIQQKFLDEYKSNLHVKDLLSGGASGIAGWLENMIAYSKADNTPDKVKYGAGMFKGIAKFSSSLIKATNAKQGKNPIAEFLGMPGKSIEDITKMVNGTRVANSFGDYFKEGLAKAVGAADGMTGAEKVLGTAGTVLTAVGDYAKAYKTYGFDDAESAGKTVAAGAAMTTVDVVAPIAINAGISTAVGAAFVAAGVASGPPGWVALAVGAAATGIWVGVNAASTALTDKSVTEWVGEGAAWVGGKVVEGAKANWNNIVQSAEKVGEVAQKAKDVACEFRDKAVEALRDDIDKKTEVIGNVVDKGKEVVSGIADAGKKVASGAKKAVNAFVGWLK